MKNKIYLILFFALVSCIHNKEEELIQKVQALEKENQYLKEKIEYLHDSRLINTIMVPFFDKNKYLPSDKGTVTFKAFDYGVFDFEYSVYESKGNNVIEAGSLVKENLKDVEFEYKFDLTQMENNKIDLKMVFVLEKKIVTIPLKAEVMINK